MSRRRRLHGVDQARQAMGSIMLRRNITRVPRTARDGM
jgi:hypothetical protein